MPSTDTNQAIQKVWNRAKKLPGGKKLFSILIGKWVPYTGSLGLLVEELRPGYGKISIQDKRPLRNHLKSLHAMALANLGEASTGLPLVYSLPPNTRCILVGFEIQYLKKARGKITGVSSFSPPEDHQEKEIEIESSLLNQDQEEVARAKARWRIGAAQKT